MVKEYDKVKKLVEKNGYPIGSVGVVVSTYSTGPACEVEIWDETEYPVDVVTLPEMLSPLPVTLRTAPSLIVSSASTTAFCLATSFAPSTRLSPQAKKASAKTITKTKLQDFFDKCKFFIHASRQYIFL